MPRAEVEVRLECLVEAAEEMEDGVEVKALTAAFEYEAGQPASQDSQWSCSCSCSHAEEYHGWKMGIDKLMSENNGNLTFSIQWQAVAPDEAGPEATEQADGATQQPEVHSNMLSVMQCINDKFTAKSTGWEGAEGGVQAVGAWWPSQPDPDWQLTIVSSGTVSRMPQLQAQCLSWQGALSAVLYQPLVQGPGPLTPVNKRIMRQAISQVSQFGVDMLHHPAACKPQLLLVYELYENEETTLLYPINLLRNLARLQVRTPLFAHLDIDLLASRSLNRLNRHSLATKLLEEAAAEPTVFIVPTFDVRGVPGRVAWAEALAASPKELVVVAMARDLLRPFDAHTYPEGHRLVDYNKWTLATSPYMATFEPGCEPWLLGDRLSLPWHDAWYRGYGWDKVQYTHQLHVLQYQFRVLHSVFAIHRPHAKSAPRLVWRNNQSSDGRSSLYARNQELFEAQKLQQHYNALDSDPITRHCLQQLPWWRNHTNSKANPVAVNL